MMAMFVLFSSYVLYLSLLLSGSKVNLACENSLGQNTGVTELYLRV